MGLDISAYSNIEFVKLYSEEEDHDEDFQRYHLVCGNAGFPGRLGSQESGFYRSTPKTEEHGFQAGSYGTYNGWRRELSIMALDMEPGDIWYDPEAHGDKPFFELICFSDCEGALGAEISAKLARDFAEFEERAEEHAKSLGEWFGEDWIYRYKAWRRAFELASENGAVCFH